MTGDILRCPFCGSTPTTRHGYVFCACDAMVPIEVWNLRYEQSPPVHRPIRHDDKCRMRRGGICDCGAAGHNRVVEQMKQSPPAPDHDRTGNPWIDGERARERLRAAGGDPEAPTPPVAERWRCPDCGREFDGEMAYRPHEVTPNHPHWCNGIPVREPVVRAGKGEK